MIDTVIELMLVGFSKVVDPRKHNKTYILSDLLGIAFAMFSLKDSSLSSFRNQYDVRAENLERIYGVTSLPGDTALREGLDEVNPSELQGLFKPQLDYLKEQKVLSNRYVLGGYVGVSVDGTGHYCSGIKGCPQCMVKNHGNGKTTYYHQLLGAVAMHPNESTVFPVACEAIVKQDGKKKNDCELNASKRIIPQIREALGEEKILVVFDALYANGPHIKALQKEKMSYIIGTKGETFVDVQVNRLKEEGKMESHKWKTDKKKYVAYFKNDLILNGKHKDMQTNYFEVTEIDIKTGKQTFYSTWITDILIDCENIRELVEVARSRWKIENETFNTLKNQGYHLEHNYGHGKKYLATNFAILTFLAFLTDQIAQHLDKEFQVAKKVCKTFKSLWEKVRSVFYLMPVMSMSAIYRFIIQKRQIKMPPLE